MLTLNDFEKKVDVFCSRLMKRYIDDRIGESKERAENIVTEELKKKQAKFDKRK